MAVLPVATPAKLARRAVLAGTVLGAGTLLYSLIEARSYRLRSVTAPVLPAGQPPLQVLHLSDLHLTPAQRSRQDWIAGLARLNPDLVVATGDLIAHPEAVASLTDALGPLLDVPGAFVFGSNDYFSPKLINPTKYFRGPSQVGRSEPDLPWRELASELTNAGWADLNNRQQILRIGDRLIDARGVDDPHIARDRYEQVAGPFDPTAVLALGVAHAPYLRVLDALALDGADLILAGHTHGGQICVPGMGALVTNCDLDTGRVKGLHQHMGSLMHVSAGLGTNPYTPIRLACPPEATLLTLVPAGQRDADW